MNLAATIWLYGGGAGSGCKGSNCGRPGGWVRNTNAFHMPPAPAAQGAEAMHHYVVSVGGEVEKVKDHATYFAGGAAQKASFGGDQKAILGMRKFLQQGGITVTVTAGGPGILFGKKDEETVDKVLQVAAHPEFREYGATVEYLDTSKGERVSFDGGVGKLARELRAWVQQKRAA